jgi:hypothetical protein
MKLRDKKKQDRKKLGVAWWLYNKRRLDDALTCMGLYQGFQDLPSAIRERLVGSLPAKPEIRVNPADQDCEQLMLLRAEIARAFEERHVGSVEEAHIPLSEFYSTYPGLAHGLARLNLRSLRRKHGRFLCDALRRVNIFCQPRCDRASILVGKEVQASLIIDSSPDQCVYECVHESRSCQFAHPLLKLTLQRAGTREAYVTLDGQRRRVYQCGLPCGVMGAHWVEHDGADFGLPGGRMYPVFIQPHALHRLKKRLATGFLTDITVKLGLWESLTRLNVVGQADEGYLIAIRHSGCRLGYLVARVVEEKIVIVTFLFLTMRGTPEFEMLAQKLRLTRRDIEHENLDRLAPFLSRDVRADADLVRILGECGCGPLLSWKGIADPDGPSANQAEELRRFFRINAEGNPKVYGRLAPSVWPAG